MADKLINTMDFGTGDIYYPAAKAENIYGEVDLANGGTGSNTAEGARANIGAASQATADELSGKINNLSVQCTDDGEGNITLTFGA